MTMEILSQGESFVMLSIFQLKKLNLSQVVQNLAVWVRKVYKKHKTLTPLKGIFGISLNPLVFFLT